MIPYVPRDDVVQGERLGKSLTSDMGAEVLRLLGERQQLPATGYVAGQAVLSALLELYGDGLRKGPINDIDVFVPIEVIEPAENQGANLFRVSEGLRENEKDYVFGVYRGYKIGSVSHEGLINRVTVHQGAAAVDVTLQGLVSSFDFNMVSVGVDASTGVMKWSDGFERFWEGGPVELQEVAAPQAALPRLLKKSKEMPWLNVDLDDLSRDCMVVFSCWKHMARIGCGFVSRPQKYIDMMEAMDPEGKLPRFEHWERGHIEPPGWNKGDFSDRQQLLLDIVRDAETRDKDLQSFGGVSHPVAAAAGLNDIGLLHRSFDVGFDINQVSIFTSNASMIGDVKAIDGDCRTALDVAAVHRSYQAFLELLKLGAVSDRTYRGVSGHLVEFHQTVNDSSISAGVRQCRLDFLLLDAVAEGSSYVSTLAVEQGSNVESMRMDGRTPFLVAAAKGDTAMCVWLQGLGADVMAVDANGNSALQLALEGAHENTAMTIRAMAARVAADAAIREMGISPAP